VLRPDGYIVLRFRADNPGVWLFHCHIEWHVDQGLIATMIEAPLDIQKSLTLPQDHIDACSAGNVPHAGNAAGNTINYLDLTGQNAAPGPLPNGFTPRGIVALTFSCISALIGLAVISWFVHPFPPLSYKQQLKLVLGTAWRTWVRQAWRMRSDALRNWSVRMRVRG
jgi:iron transport multicopper oxidase